jgi:predicted GNAT family acetyltransferase
VIEVTHNEAAARYEVRDDGELVGLADYLLTDDTIVLHHTEVDRAHQGKGIAGDLVKAALDDIRATGGRRVVPRCSYVRAWIARHPEYADLTTAASSTPPDSD